MIARLRRRHRVLALLLLIGGPLIAGLGWLSAPDPAPEADVDTVTRIDSVMTHQEDQ